MRLDTVARFGAAGLGFAGLVHLLVPDLLLRLAAVGYDRVLAVDFEPRANATRRVRALGLTLVALAVALWHLADRE